MHFEFLRTLPEMQALSGEWNTHLKDSAIHVPFLRHEYLTTWWQTLGGGEWPMGELFTVTAHHEDGTLAGIAPLFLTNNCDGERALMFLGSIEISDYLDVIARPEHLPQFTIQLLDFLSGPQAPEFKLLDLYNLLDNSPTIPALQQAAASRGWTYSQELLQHCPYIPLPGDWETYLAGIDKKQRHEIRRKMRRAEEYDQSVRWYIVEDAASLESEMEGFFDLMAQDPAKASFLTPMMRQQMKTSAQAAFQAGWLQLAFLEVDGKKTAGYINFDYDNHIWVYNSGLDFGYRELSPGWVLLGYLLQWANEHERQYFDFMRGDEEYKYKFGAVDRRVMRVMLRS
jgi:CelD/BcsL family acetyltransferase involved in cellulose biosynthesis